MDGGWIINGTKTWVSNGGLAGVYVVFALTDPAAGSRGHERFRGAGRDARPGPSAGARRRWGCAGASITRLYLTTAGCRRRTCWAGQGQGYRIALETLDFGRIGVSAIGRRRGAERALESRRQLCQRARPVRRADRAEAGHPGVPGRCGHRSGRGRVPGAPRRLAGRPGQAGTRSEAAMAKLFCQPDGCRRDRSGGADPRRLSASCRTTPSSATTVMRVRWNSSKAPARSSRLSSPGPAGRLRRRRSQP